MNTSANKANISAVIAAIVTMVLVLDKRFMWDLGPEFWGSGGVILTWLAVYFVPNAGA